MSFKFVPRQLEKRKFEIAKKIKIETFDGRVLTVDDMTHSHLSNCYWFQIIFNSSHIIKGSLLDVMINTLENKFNNEILPYRPHPNFRVEIKFLELKGMVTADKKIIFQDKEIGYLIDEPLND